MGPATSKIVIIQPYDSLFFGGGIGVPLRGSSRSLIHPTPLTVSGSILSLLIEIEGEDRVLTQRAMEGSNLEELEERGMALNYAFYGPLIIHRNEFWVPAPRDLIINWARRKDMKLEVIPQDAKSGGYGTDLEPPLLGPDDLYLYDHFDFPLAPLEELTSSYAYANSMLIKGAPRIYTERRLGITLDRSKGAVEMGFLYRTIHIRGQESKRGRMSYAMISIPVDGREEVSDLSGVTRLGGEGRVALITTENRSIRWLGSDRQLKEGDEVKVILISPAIYLGNDGTTTSTPDVSELPGRPEFVSPRVISSRPLMISGWNFRLRRARRMYAAVPPGTVYRMRVREPVEMWDLMISFWKLSLYWDRGMGSPLFLKVQGEG